jgi:hypothetical protein
MSLEQTDRYVLEAIVEALERVGRELDAADRLPDHDPWPAIARQEEAVRHLAGQLSEGFWAQHAPLSRRLAEATALHLRWGSLQDQLRRILSPSSSPSPDISS